MREFFSRRVDETIVVLGGGIQQTRCIKRSKKIGFKVCCFDINENCQGAKVADLFYQISIKDYSEILLVVSSIENVVAILAPATEIGNLTASYIAGKLGLPYNREEVIKTTCNKSLMRDKLDLLRLDNPKHFSFTNETN